jgi:hypothetical protein
MKDTKLKEYLACRKFGGYIIFNDDCCYGKLEYCIVMFGTYVPCTGGHHPTSSTSPWLKLSMEKGVKDE